MRINFKRTFIIAILFCFFFFPFQSFAGDGLLNTYRCSVLTGGGAGSIDKLPYADLEDDDAVICMVAGDKVYHYVFNEASEAAESSPDVITPDDYGSAAGRWLLVVVYQTAADVNVTDTLGRLAASNAEDAFAELAGWAELPDDLQTGCYRFATAYNLNVAWRIPNDNRVTHCAIYRAEYPGDFGTTPLAIVAYDSSPYNDTSGSLDTMYQYKITSCTDDACTSESDYKGILLAYVNSEIDENLLPDTAVTPGSYTNANITVDAHGRVTTAANGSVYAFATAGDFPTSSDTMVAPDTMKTYNDMIYESTGTTIPKATFTQDSGILVGTGAGTYQEETGATLRTSIGCDPIGTDNSTDVTLNASATTGGMSINTQEISNQAATNAQNGYMTSTLVGNIETNNAKVTYPGYVFGTGAGDMLEGDTTPADIGAEPAISTLSHEKGGLEADVSAYDGVLKITGGSTAYIKYNFGTSAAPTVNDDIDEGYSKFSPWIQTGETPVLWTCLDNTDGAAVWSQGGGGGGGITVVNATSTGTVTTASLGSSLATLHNQSISAEITSTFEAPSTSFPRLIVKNCEVIQWNLAPPSGNYFVLNGTALDANDIIVNAGAASLDGDLCCIFVAPDTDGTLRYHVENIRGFTDGGQP